MSEIESYLLFKTKLQFICDAMVHQNQLLGMIADELKEMNRLNRERMKDNE